MEQTMSLSRPLAWKNVRFTLMHVAIFLSIVSQMPLLRLVAGIPTQLLIYPGWLLLGAVTLVQGVQIRQRLMTTTLFPAIIWIILMTAMEIGTGNRYVTSGLSVQFYMALFLTWIGYTNSDIFFEEFLSLSRTFLFGSMLLGMDIYWEFFRGYSLTTIDYVFRSKNSAAFILLMATLLAAVNWAKQSIVERGARAVLVAFFTYLCIVMRSRAVLVGLILFILYWGYSSPRSSGVKLLYTLVLVALVATVWFYVPLNELIIQNIFLNGLEVANLNEVSSNRLEYFTVVQSQMNELLFGIAEYYMDNFYLESLLNNGWILGFWLIALALMPLRMVKIGITKTSMERFLTILVIVHIVNAAFEGYTPFGPGTKCMLLWLFYGAWEFQKERKR